jgi:hypothetical protein
VRISYDTYTLPPAAGPTALNNDIALISIPFAAPLSFIVCKPHFSGQNVEQFILKNPAYKKFN